MAVNQKKPVNQKGQVAKPAPKKKPRSKVNGALMTWIAVGVVVAVVATIVLIKSLSSTNTTNNFGPTTAAVYHDLTTIPASVYNEVGVSSPAIQVYPPGTAKNQPPLTYDVNGKVLPGIFYYGAEYCPYCAATRWSLIAALARFGTWDNNRLYNMLSSSTDYAPNTPTFSFYQTSYSSPSIAFRPYEVEDRNQQPLQQLPAMETKLIKKYNPHRSFPFIDIGNRFFQSTAFDPAVLAGATRDQIASALNDPTNQFTKAIITSANLITASICAVDKSAPASVCHSAGVKAAAVVMRVTL